jgi:hypothetical protein
MLSDLSDFSSEPRLAATRLRERVPTRAATGKQVDQAL